MIAFMLIILSAFSCSSLYLTRTDGPEKISGPPEIERLIDLGSLPPNKSGVLSREMSDNIFTPGEWAAVIGKNIAAQDTQITIGKKNIPISGFLKGGYLLIRIPRGLSPYKKQSLTLKTRYGKSKISFNINSYVVINDPGERKLRFYRTLVDNRNHLEERTVIQVYPGCNYRLSPRGGFIYFIQRGESKLPDIYSLVTVHMGQSSRPKKVSTITFENDTPPSAMDIDQEGRTLLLLSKSRMLTFTIGNPLKPRLLCSFPLPSPGKFREPSFRKSLFLHNGKKAVILENLSNTLYLIDLNNPENPRLLQTLKAAPGITLPVIIDMVSDRKDATSFWVLQGPNMGLSHQGLIDFLINLSTAKNSTDPEKDDKLTGPRQIVNLVIKEDRLEIKKKILLPGGFFPLSMKKKQNGGMLISGVNYDLLKFLQLKPTFEGMKKALVLLKDTIQLGRIISISEKGNTKTVAQGLSIFLSIDTVPENGSLIYTVMKIGPRYIPPSVGIDLGFEIREKQYILIRKLSWETMLPPYTIPAITFQ